MSRSAVTFPTGGTIYGGRAITDLAGGGAKHFRRRQIRLIK